MATLRPLAAVLVTCTAIGLVGWMVQVGADAGGVRSDRAATIALIQEASFAVEDGVHLTALAAGARFTRRHQRAARVAVPGRRGQRRAGTRRHFPELQLRRRDARLRGAAGAGAMMALVALGALYGGFAAARTVKARTLGTGAAWGAITGPAWAVAMATLVVLAGGLFHGDADDASVFGVFLIGGALLGAAAARSRSAGRRPAAPRPRPLLPEPSR